MILTVKLFANLRQGRFKVRDMDFSEGTTVQQVMEYLSISKKEMAIGIIFINGKRANFDSVLEDHDTLAIFPPVAGG